MTITEPTGWERRRERISLQIEKVALDLFAGHGFEAVTVGEIAQAAGISDRTFYRYFPTKDDVLLALPRRYLSRVHDALLAQPTHLAPLAAIRAAFVEINAERSDAKMLLRWVKVTASSAPNLVSQSVDAASSYRDFLALRLGRDPHRDLQVKALAAALDALQSVAFTEWLRSGGQEDFAALSDAAIEALAELIGEASAPVARLSRSSKRTRRALPVRHHPKPTRAG